MKLFAEKTVNNLKAQYFFHLCRMAGLRWNTPCLKSGRTVPERLWRERGDRLIVAEWGNTGF